jgi:hypothetical protein
MLMEAEWTFLTSHAPARVRIDQLINQGRAEKAERLRRFGLNTDGSIACA